MEVYREAALTAVVTIVFIIVLLWVYDLIFELRHLNKYHPRPTVDISGSGLQLVPWGQNREISNAEQYQNQFRRNSPIRSVPSAAVALKEIQYTPSLQDELNQALLRHHSKATPKAGTGTDRSPVKEVYSSFLVACYNCDVVRITTFIKAGVDILQKTRNGETGLLLATYQMAKRRRAWNPVCLQILVSNGCLINERTIDDNTALHIAVKHTHLTAVKWLLENGASVDIKNKTGWRPVDIAQAQGRYDIVDVLLEAADAEDSSEVKDEDERSDYHSAL